jgi:hypothetical protein
MLGDRRKTGVMVEVMDLTHHISMAKAQLQDAEDSGSGRKVIDVSHRHPWGRVVVGNDVYVLCSEGVGSNQPIDDGEYAFEVEYWGRLLTDEDREVLEIYPRIKHTFTEQEVKHMPIKEEVPLEQFIRRFGQRLETNFEMWAELFSELVEN